MSPEQQRIAIAEACGWDMDPAEAREWGSRGQWAMAPASYPYVWPFKPGELVPASSAPNYLNDLNAMHEAERVLLADIRNLAPYKKHLAYATCLAGEPISHATAAQRAEAFLRTVGKWEGEQ